MPLLRRIRRAPLVPRTSIALTADTKLMIGLLKRRYHKAKGLWLSSSTIISLAIEALQAGQGNDGN